MNNYKVLLISLLFSVFLTAQSTIHFEEFTLDNGLKVYLNEDHSQPNAVGAIIVKGGGKSDPADATGIAHYLEHLLFKGTDSLGTVDYAQEKVYLDSIEMKYEELSKTKDEDQRKAIQKEINKLSLKAADFAIPNEFDQLVSSFGGTGLNAFTSEDNIAYFNSFPGEKTPLWIELYSHRFINPVFRLFQAELEAVYEEKNMYADDMFTAVLEKLSELSYPNHPYGTQTILGSTEHLKNPSLIKMREYYEKYYVPNNMALIMSGNFSIEEIKPMIENHFGAWKRGDDPDFPEVNDFAFDGVVKKKYRLTPIKVGALIFRGVEESHEDIVKLKVMENILSNYGSTGLLDELRNDSKIMMAGIMLDSKVDLGNLMILYLPKVIGQSLNNAESLVLEQLSALKKGDFDDQLLEIAKIELKKSFEENLENMNYRVFYLIDMFNNNQTWEEFIKYPSLVDEITKEDIIQVANKYFVENYVSMRSKTGFPKKDKVTKPGYDPVVPKNSEADSDYAKRLKAKDTLLTEPIFVSFEKGKKDNLDVDVQIVECSDLVTIYHGKNPVNNIFKMNLSFGLGTEQNPMLAYAGSHFSELGTKDYSYSEMNKRFQLLGASYYTYASSNQLVLSISGLDENLEETMALVGELIYNLKPNPDKIKMLYQDEKQMRKTEAKSPEDIGLELYSYSKYLEDSDGLTRLPLKKIKKLDSEELINHVENALTYELSVTYTGNNTPSSVKKSILKNIKVDEIKNKGHFNDHKPYVQPEENIVYFINDKKAVQSQIYIWSPGSKLDEEKRLQSRVFNTYFGGGMEGLVFQEIREFRSLAYSCWGYYSTPVQLDADCYFMCGLSTQADKSNEALDVFIELMRDMPKKEERYDKIKTSLLQSINAGKSSFRYIPNVVASWDRQGKTEDPAIKTYDFIQNKFTFDDITDFYNSEIQKDKQVICIVGNKKEIDLDELAKYGKVKILKQKDILVN